jgi:hypothetical protein
MSALLGNSFANSFNLPVVALPLRQQKIQSCSHSKQSHEAKQYKKVNKTDHNIFNTVLLLIHPSLV